MKTDEFIYPESMNELFRGTKYQVKDIITGEWSETREIKKMCSTVKEYLELMLRRKSIRIIDDKGIHVRGS